MAVGVAAGACHSLAWDAAGAAFAWGHGGNGRLGLGGACKRPSPQRVALAKPVSAASAGANFSLFVVDSGQELFACGGNQYGQLGIDASQAFTPVSVQIPLAEDEVIAAVESGTNHVICLTQMDGEAEGQATVWAWGCASSGQCGPNAAFESQARPLKLGDFSPPSPHRAVAVAAGRSHSAVLAFTGNTPGWPRARARLRPAARTPREKSRPRKAERSEQAEDIIEEFLTGLAQPSRFRASKLFVLLAAAVALLKLLPDLDFLGGDSKPAVKPGGAYDGSDINPEEMGATEWERNWWRDMKTQQEALNKKAAIEQSRGDEDGEGVKTLLYLFGFLVFGTFLVFLPGPLHKLFALARAAPRVTMAEEALFMGEGVTEKVRNPTSELSSRLGGRLIRRSGQGQQENRRFAGRRGREQKAPQLKPSKLPGTGTAGTEPLGVSKAPRRTKPGLGTGALLAEALAAEDQWSGIRESLKGLSSYIAQLSDTPVKAPLASWAPVPAVVQPGVGAMGTAFAQRCRISSGGLGVQAGEWIPIFPQRQPGLTRERSLELLIEAMRAGRYHSEEVEKLALESLDSDSWEAKQGGLQAASEAIKHWDQPVFREAVLEKVPDLLTDREYRVRKATAAVLRECCLRDGLAVYDKMGKIVLHDIQDKFKRPQEEEPPSEPGQGYGEAPAPPAPPTFLHDTEGWRSLETSMGALEAMMQGCGMAFTPRIDDSMLSLMEECSRHTNRFVREYTYFALKNVFEVCSQEAFMATVAPKTVHIVAAGIKDNWSQVRYAASVAARAFNEKAGDRREAFYPQLLGLMCLNRHYVAEGVRNFSQDTWKQVCGPQGGARLLVAHFDSVIDAYVDAATAPNHAVREAACNCISELAARVAGAPSNPTPYREHFTPPRVQRLLKALLDSSTDESWPVRDVASTALGFF
ncbi:UVR8, partial [Symbiodinium sp. CCMP2456]